ncbi:MAG: ATP-dependent DNA helicase RecG [Christensenellales bacterium]|jgi:ATP-dependent DNA helicase RecG
MNPLDQPLSVIAGIGAVKSKQFQKLGVLTIQDALFLLPKDYRDISEPRPIGDLTPGVFNVFIGRVQTEPKTSYPRSGFSVTRAYIEDGVQRIGCIWYRQPYIKNRLKAGETYLVYGYLDAKSGVVQNPEFELLGEVQTPILPVYRTTPGLSQRFIRNTLSACLKSTHGILPETLPESLRLKHELCERNFAVQNIHFPCNMEVLQQAKHRLAFEELCLFQIFMSLLSGRNRQPAPKLLLDSEVFLQLQHNMPFTLTDAQRRVLSEVRADLASGSQMNRIVQGDVGSGKTVIALGAIHIVVQNGMQAAVMAPTEILAIQHYESALAFFNGSGYRIGLLKGKMKAAERRKAYESIQNGEWDVIIGTQALIQEGVVYRNLGLVVADEQHRFGVNQRALLKGKGDATHMLIMSATPIPRTLALILYGDLDLSVIDELPPGRKPVITKMVPPSKREAMFQYLKKELAKGKQAYIVCPLVEESEGLDVHSAQELYEELRVEWPDDIRIALLHGKMRPAEKEHVIQCFKQGEYKALVATTVVEVGVNVPNASIMVIMDAHRFGLSQLHQLRGRVGRGNEQSYCFLYSPSNAKEALQRLQLMCSSSDGFLVAQQDLQMRGPGEFLGNRQHGAGNFKMAHLMNDVQLLEETKKAAQEVVGADDEVKAHMIELTMEKYSDILEKIVMN